MRICVFGAGAIGGYLAAKLAAVDGLELSLVARGPHLAAIRANGLRADRGRQRDTSTGHAPPTTPAELGAQDYVILGAEGAFGLAGARRHRAAARPARPPW